MRIGTKAYIFRQGTIENLLSPVQENQAARVKRALACQLAAGDRVLPDRAGKCFPIELGSASR
jgi:hypothetical protein